MIAPQVLHAQIPYGLHLHSRAESLTPTLAVLALNALAWWVAGCPLASVANLALLSAVLACYLLLRRAARAWREPHASLPPSLPAQRAPEQ